jgi:beta-lactamase regulating signal transducer with metallopeptidase domain
VEPLLSLVAGAALKATGILAVAAVVTAAWRTASASARHLVWAVAVTAALLLPFAAAAVSSLGAPRVAIPFTMPVATVTASIALPEEVMTGTVPDVGAIASPGPQVEEIAAPPSPIESPVAAQIELPSLAAMVASAGSAGSMPRWERKITILWAIGALLALLPLLIATLRIAALARSARPVGGGRWKYLIEATPAISHLAARVRILESPDASMPMTWGCFRPTLLIPANTTEWPDWKCRNILLHELAHVERRDCLTQLVAQVTCAVYWFNPLAWMAAHRMRLERELACDDRVIAAGSAASDYASNLLDVARSLRAPSFTSPTAIAMARPSQLSGRLLAVLDARRNRAGVSRPVFAAASISAAVLVVVLASLTTRAAVAVAAEAPADRVPIVTGDGMVAPAPAAAASFAPVPFAIVKATQIPAVGIAASHGDAAAASVLREIGATTPAAPLLAQSRQSCWADGEKSNVSITSNTDKSRESWTVRYSRDDCTLEVRAEGKFRMRADLSDLESIDRDGWFRVEEREGRSSKRVEIRAASGGGLEHQYWVNGNRTPFNDEGRRWLAATLLGVERRTAFAAETRVPQLYNSGGMRRVLDEIAQMTSAYPKSRYYGELLDLEGQLDAAQLSQIVGRVSEDLASSDYYTSQVLGRLASQPAANDGTWRTFAQAAGRMKSDYYKAQLLKTVLKNGRLSNETVGTLLNAAGGMESDYYLSDLLKGVASKYAVNESTRSHYASALTRIESDFYRMELLKSLESTDAWDERTASFVLNSVREMKSDYYKSQSLSSLAKKNHVANWSAFFGAVGTIGSDHYKRMTLTATLNREPLTKDVVSGVLAATSTIRSDHDKSQVLGAVANSYRLDDALRVAYEKAADTINSEHYRGSALVALRRNQTR